MRIPSLARLNRVGKWMRRMTSRKALILLYHRVIERETDPQLLAVTPSLFEEHLQIIQREYRPLSLMELCRAIKQGTIPPRSVVVTFDDGYADNLYHAKPLLEQYGIPATVFVTCGQIRNRRALWWDELADFFLQPSPLPRGLDLTIREKSYHWDPGDPALSQEETAGRWKDWTVLERTDPTPRHSAYRSLCRLLRDFPESEREDVMNDIRKWAGKEGSVARDDLVLSAEEILLLVQGGVVDVGGHTMTHPVLATLPPERQLDEVRTSKRLLEEILGRPVTSFAYPVGSRADYTRKTVGIIRESGFECACSNYPDMVWRWTSLFQLPRFIVRNWNGELFKKRMEEWFHG